MKEFMPLEKSLVSEVPRVRSSNGGTFKKLKKLCSGARSHPYFGSSNGQKFRQASELSTNLIKDLVRIWYFGLRSELYQTRGNLKNIPWKSFLLE
jgi:hypothetical protein